MFTISSWSVWVLDSVVRLTFVYIAAEWLMDLKKKSSLADGPDGQKLIECGQVHVGSMIIRGNEYCGLVTMNIYIYFLCYGLLISL